MRVEFLLKKIREHARLALEAFPGYHEKEDTAGFNNLAMECFQASNYMIDLAEEAVARNDYGFPSTYAENFSSLRKNGLLTNQEEEILVKMVSLRNKIAHEYHVINPGQLVELYEIVSRIVPVAEKIVKGIKE